MRFTSLDAIWKAPAGQNELMFSVLQDWPRWALQCWSAEVIFQKSSPLDRAMVLFPFLGPLPSNGLAGPYSLSFSWSLSPSLCLCLFFSVHNLWRLLLELFQVSYHWKLTSSTWFFVLLLFRGSHFLRWIFTPIKDIDTSVCKTLRFIGDGWEGQNIYSSSRSKMHLLSLVVCYALWGKYFKLEFWYFWLH